MGKNENVLVEFKKGKDSFRIMEVQEYHYDMNSLKGDCFNPNYNPEIDPDELKRQEREFEKKVYNEGVYGYVLEKWNPAVGVGWEHQASCWRFVGRYDKKNNDHYIVDELRYNAE